MKNSMEKQKDNLMVVDRLGCSKETFQKKTAEEVDKYIVVHEYGYKTEYKIITKEQLIADFGIVEFQEEECEALGEFEFKCYEDSEKKLIDIYKPLSEESFNLFMKDLKDMNGIEIQ